MNTTVTSTSRAREVLAQVKCRRELEQALDRLRTRTRFKRNVPILGVLLGFAALQIWRAFDHGMTVKIDGIYVFTVDGVLNLASAAALIAMAVQNWWINPSDRLLLELAEKAFAASEKPSHPPEPGPR